ncbi:MAG: ComEC/Rec2 family competence protein [Patescibacteria group bacterium]
MGSLTLLAVIFGRRNLSLLSLVLAVSTMLVLNPSWIGDLSFQLSVLATLGIILFGGKGNAPSSVIPAKAGIQFIRDSLRITLAAQLFTTPLIFFHFHRLSLIAPLTNVLIGWTMPFLMGLGWIAAVAGYIWQPLGLLPAWAAWILLAYVIRAVEVTAGFPLAGIAW